MMLLGEVDTEDAYEGNVRAGVRYLRWQLDQFDGDVEARARRLLPGRPRRSRARPLRRHEAVRVGDPAALRLGLSLLARRRSGDLDPLAATATTDARDVTAEEPFAHLGVVELELPQGSPAAAHGVRLPAAGPRDLRSRLGR